MSRQFISVLFSIVFLAFIAGPTIIVLVDDSVDISIFYTSAEEEEKGNEKNKDVEKIVFNPHFASIYIAAVNPTDELGYIHKKYSKPHLNLVSPPPEYIVLF